MVKGRGRASIHVDEIVDALMLAMLEPRAFGRTFNLLNPNTWISDLELYGLVIAASGSRSALRSVEQGDASPLLGSIDQAQKILGWRPWKTKQDLEAVVARAATARPSS